MLWNGKKTLTFVRLWVATIARLRPDHVHPVSSYRRRRFVGTHRRARARTWIRAVWFVYLSFCIVFFGIYARDNRIPRTAQCVLYVWTKMCANIIDTNWSGKKWSKKNERQLWIGNCAVSISCSFHFHFTIWCLIVDGMSVAQCRTVWGKYHFDLICSFWWRTLDPPHECIARVQLAPPERQI